VIWVTKYKRSTYTRVNNGKRGNNAPIHLTEALLLCTYAVLSEDVSSCDARGPRIDDFAGTTSPHLNRKLMRVFQREEAERPPCPYFPTRRGHAQTSLWLCRPRPQPQLRAITWRFAGFFSLSLFSLSTISRCRIALPRKRFSVHLYPVFLCLNVDGEDMYLAGRHLGASYIGPCPRWACPSTN
jgi:hypothetical protein